VQSISFGVSAKSLNPVKKSYFGFILLLRNDPASAQQLVKVP
jgi:hypothetical protein